MTRTTPAAPLEPGRPAPHRIDHQEQTMNDPQTADPIEPDHPAAWALARHIADHSASTIQAAFRYLNAPLTIELHESAAVPVSAAAPEARLDLDIPRLHFDTPADRAACPDPIECGHEAALGQAQQEVRRLGLMVDEYGAGASALTDKLRRVRELHREVCPVAQGVILPPAAVCGLCEVLDAPAAVLPPTADRAAVLRETADFYDQLLADMGGAVECDPRYWQAIQRVATELRGKAAEAPEPATQDEAVRPTAVRRKLRRWAYAAGHIESELDGVVDGMYALIAQDITAGSGPSAAVPVGQTDEEASRG